MVPAATGTNNLEPRPCCSSRSIRSNRGNAGIAMETEVGGGDPYSAPSVAPIVERWVSACFPEGSESSVRELEEVIQEASDAAQDDYDEASANEWAGGVSVSPAVHRQRRRVPESSRVGLHEDGEVAPGANRFRETQPREGRKDIEGRQPRARPDARPRHRNEGSQAGRLRT